MRDVRRLIDQLDTSSPADLKRDLGRLAQAFGSELSGLALSTVERWKPGRPTSRHELRFDQLTAIDTVGDDATAYLPRALAQDAGRRCVLVKTRAANAVRVVPVSGAVVNTFSEWSLSEIGLHEIWWDGAKWWVKEPRARVRRHDTTHSPLGLWQFDTFSTAGEDTSGNGLDLTVEAGTKRTIHVFPGVEGIYLDGSTSWYESTGASSLELTGDMTFEALCIVQTASNNDPFFTHQASGETEATNQLYGLKYDTAPAVLWLQESGAGVNATHAVGNAMMMPGQLCHMAVTRTSGVVQAYLNGRRWGSASSALTTPTGGGSGNFRLGSDATPEYFHGAFASVKLIGSALSAAQVRAEYNRTMGPAFGFVDA